MHLKPSHRDFLDERLRLRVEGEPRKDEHLVTVHLRRRDRLLHLVGNHRSVLGTKADGNAERIAILLRFCFGVQVAQVERPDVHQLQFLAAGEENAALLFEEVDHHREIVAAAVVDAPWFGRRGNPLWLPWVDTGVYPYGIFKLRDGRLRRVFNGWHRYGFYGEGASDAHHAAHDPGAVVERLLGRVASGCSRRSLCASGA
jgi:hypothetical protein